MNLPTLVEDPVLEDTADFSEQEAAEALPTQHGTDMSQQIAAQLGDLFAVKGFEMCRKDGHIYVRVTLTRESGPHRVLVFHADWMTEGEKKDGPP